MKQIYLQDLYKHLKVYLLHFLRNLGVDQNNNLKDMHDIIINSPNGYLKNTVGPDTIKELMDRRGF